MEMMIGTELNDGPGERLWGFRDERGAAVHELHSLRAYRGRHDR
jgi:hypothetical protein